MKVLRSLATSVGVSNTKVTLPATKYLFNDRSWCLAFPVTYLVKAFPQANLEAAEVVNLENTECVLIDGFVEALCESYPNLYTKLTSNKLTKIGDYKEVSVYQDIASARLVKLSDACVLLDINKLSLHYVSFFLELDEEDSLIESPVIHYNTFKRLVARSKCAQAKLRKRASSRGFASSH